MKRIVAIFALLVFSAYAFAGVGSGRIVPDSTVVMRFQIHYPVNSTEIHENYMGNARMLPYIQEFLQKSPRIDSITIYSSASPEGPYPVNKRLAMQRGMKAKQYLVNHIPADRQIPDSIIIINPTAENWEGLRELIKNEYPYRDRADLLRILDRTDITDEERKVRLKKLDYGNPWKFVRDSLLPKLRYATWIAVWVYIERDEDLHIMPDYGYTPPVTTAPIVMKVGTIPEYKYPVIEEEEPEQTRTLFALKSNLLYDALSLVNYSVELPLYKNKLSMVLYHQFPWWRWGEAKNEYCLRFLSVGGEARWWFLPKVHEATDRRIRRDKFTGHFLGVYSESGKYDFERQRDICYQGELWSAGLSYGYAMPIGKRLNMEFSISAGYASIAYRGYTPSEDYEILWRDPDKVGRWHYFGPTKVQVSLVVPITAKIKGGYRR